MTLDEDQFTAARRAKLERLRAAGIDPFPPHFHRTHTAAQVHAAFESLQQSGTEVVVAGRVMFMRVFGKASFVQLQDASGPLQLYLNVDHLGAEGFQLFRETVDLGDLLGARGPVFVTRTGERTVEVHQWSMLAKALRPLPEKWHGLSDVETRLRRRHLDLISNAETRELLTKRAAIVREIRNFLDERGFVEVETPVLQPLHGGAAARPFVTHYNALDRQVYLRIALELYLKRLLIGGVEKVYEIGRVFRNEGLSRKHNPEFTMLESYEAYADYEDVMRLVEEMISTVAKRVLGTMQLTVQGHSVDLTPPWPRLTLRQAILERSGIDYTRHATLDDLDAAVRRAGLRVEPQKTRAQLIDQLLSTCVEPAITQPVFFTDYPLELSPFAKLKPGSTDTVERFEAFAAGVELANAFTELNDPDDQYRRFLEQVRQGEAGDEEAHVMDLDFIEAMQQGMPPAGGLGIGIDRLAMFLLDMPNIREVIYFPMLREVD
jgi:lysyl-tRNA synthetase class 2